MAPLSATYLGLIVISNSLFLCTYIVVRAVRLKIDDLPPQEQSDEISSTSETSDDKETRFATQLQDNPLLAFLIGPFFYTYRTISGLWKPSNPETQSNRMPIRQYLSSASAFGIGITSTQVLTERQFHDFRPIPYKAGALWTVGLIVLFSLLFSGRALNQAFGLAPTNVGGNEEFRFCSSSDIESKMATIRSRLETRTNYRSAIRQVYWAERFREALQKDTALYGESGYECQAPPRTKEEFLNSPGFGKDFGTTYFPGYCEEAQLAALEIAKDQTCTRSICRGGEVVDPSSIKPGEVHFSCTTIFNANCNNNLALGVGLFFGQKPDVDVTVDQPTWGYTNMSFCAEHVQPCPDFSEPDRLSNILKDYRQVALEQAAAKASEIAAPLLVDEGGFIPEQYKELLERLLRQFEIVSYIFVVYRCLGLLFPAPMVLLRQNLGQQIIQFFLSAEKLTFLLVTLSIWWGVSYFQTFDLIDKVSHYLWVFQQDPCVSNQQYFQDVGGNISQICGEMVQLKSDWAIDSSTIKNILQLVPFMNDCGCNQPFPYVSLGEVMSNMTKMEKDEDLYSFGFHWNEDGGSICGESCYLFSDKAWFAGNMEACEDNSYVRQEILDIAEGTKFSWWELWIGSGILAAVLLKTGVANLGVALLRYADPLVTYGGVFLGPPPELFTMSDGMAKDLKHSTEHYTRMWALGGWFFWGVAMNLMIANIFVASQRSDYDGGNSSGSITAGASLLVLAIVALVATRYASRMIMHPTSDQSDAQSVPLPTGDEGA